MRTYTPEQLHDARQKANLLSLASLDVALFDASGDKDHGHEYRGPCPFCQEGHDRFVVFTVDGRFNCRKCGKKGDSLQYLMYKHGWDLPTAVNHVNGDGWQPPEAAVPTIVGKPARPASPFDYELWRDRLEPMLYHATDTLSQMTNEGALAASHYLARRGIGGDAIGRYGLGYNPGWKTIYRIGDDKYTLFPGLLLPRFAHTKEKPMAHPVTAVNVYLAKEARRVVDGELITRRMVKGSKYGMQTAFGEHLITRMTTAVWVCEGELDTVLLSQFLPDGHEAITWGGANCQPHDTSLLGGKTVYLCPHNDKAGQAAVSKWLALCPGMIMAHVPGEYKDLTDFWRGVRDAGIDAWLNNFFSPMPSPSPIMASKVKV